jgi:acyl carrier protein
MSYSQIEIKNKIRKFIKANFMIMDNDIIGDDDSFVKLGIIDSTGVLEVVDLIKSDFGITIADCEMFPENLDSISKIASYIIRKCGSKDK